MLNNLAPQSVIKAIDSVAGKPVISPSPLCSEMGSLHGTLKQGIGAPVMLTANVECQMAL